MSGALLVSNVILWALVIVSVTVPNDGRGGRILSYVDVMHRGGR